MPIGDDQRYDFNVLETAARDLIVQPEKYIVPPPR